MITSKLTSKAQTTIPQPVRAALKLHDSDELMYEIADQHVILTKVRRGGATDDPVRHATRTHTGVTRQSLRAPEAFTTFSHFVISPARNTLNASGVLPTGSAPSSANLRGVSGACIKVAT